MLAVMYRALLKQIHLMTQPHRRGQRGLRVEGLFAVSPEAPSLNATVFSTQSVGRHRKKAGLYVKILLDIT